MEWKNAGRYAISETKIFFFNAMPGLSRWYYKVFWSPSNPIEQHIHQTSKRQSAFHFLQIGANDGMINDPILKFILRDGWSGVRVEPLQAPFQKLDKLHRTHSRVRPMQGVVAVAEGIMPIYHYSFSEKRWATGLASFDRAVLQGHIDSGHVVKRARKFKDVLPANQHDWITSTELQVLEINQLIMTEFSGTLDLLQIDAEGYDVALVNALDLSKLNIQMICFEKLHATPLELEATLQRLSGFGYQTFTSDMDILAYKN